MLAVLLQLQLAHAAPAVSQVLRREIVADRRDAWEVVPLGAEGLLLVGSDDRGDAFTFTRYDADFAPLWTRDWAPPVKVELRGAWVDGGDAWLLLHGRGADFTVLGVDLATGEPTAFPLTSPVKRTREVEGLFVRGDDAWLTAGRGAIDPVEGGDGTLVHVDLPAGTVEALDVAGLVGAKDVRIRHVQPTAEGVSVVATLDTQRHRTLYVVDVKGGDMSGALALSPPEEDDTNLLGALRVPASTGGDLVVGTYAQGATDVGAQGMFLARYVDGRPDWLRYHSFLSFQHFFDYLPPAMRERLDRRIERKAEKGLELDLGYRVSLHAPLVIGNRYVLVGEAYYPQYHTVTTTTTANGTTTSTSHQVFDGWRYTHAVVAAFDQLGDLMWDASVPIGNVLSPTIRDQVAVSVEGDHVHMLYCVGGKVYSLQADGDEVSGEKAEQRLIATGGDATVKASWESRAAWWYDDWFLLWGYERIKEKGARRTVFAFSKVSASR
jgi:hypothetical protein